MASTSPKPEAKSKAKSKAGAPPAGAPILEQQQQPAVAEQVDPSQAIVAFQNTQKFYHSVCGYEIAAD